ncbi:MAG: hypothetical protein J6X44_02225 [Thermoguttaceae bacterium]|nr:hypothetical protein [Thermoguttaceae bacterium]
MSNFKTLFVAAFATCLCLTSAARAQETRDMSVLPAVGAMAAEPTPHFPSRLAAFVWRNWNLAEIERMAETVEATPDELREVANALGLPEYQPPTWDPARSYITIVRRNWSLLPFDQLLTLLRFEPKEFAEKLREDDFLSVKLGDKPTCEPLIYAKPSEEEFAQMRKIARNVRDALGAELETPGVDRFAFLEEFSDDANASEPVVENAEKESASQFEICYLHSYFAVFGDPLLQDSSLLYPDKLFEKLQARGVNGVWLHSLLRDLTPGTSDFPEFGEKSEIRRANLRDLVDRGKKYGVDVYLYMNEPRSMPASFFDSHPDEKGVAEGGYCAMCASAPKVRKWLVDSLEYLFNDVPGLGGVFTISGSENLTTCVSHGRFGACPRCSQFSDVDLIVDLNAAIEEGVHKAAPDAKVIVWDWGWRGHAIATDIVERLPKNVWLQSVSEWSIPLDRGGVPTTVGEYSISVVGPGPRATAHWAAAKKAGLKTIAKCQFNSTWEIASIPSIPSLELVARHAFNLSRAGVDGVMAGWSLGGYPSVNLEVVHAFATDPDATVDGVLDRLARDYFGEHGAPLARKGWKEISTAFEEFPYGGSVIYCAPTQIGPANLLREQATGMRASMVGIPYDDLGAWVGPYPPQIFADQMRKCGKGFLDGAKKLNAASKFTPDSKRDEALRQARYAEVAGVNYLSVANQTRFILLRDERNALLKELEENGADSAKEARVQELADEMIPIAQPEIELAKRLRKACLEDSCIGFESTNQYWFVPNDLVEKIISCLDIIENLRR